MPAVEFDGDGPGAYVCGPEGAAAACAAEDAAGAGASAGDSAILGPIPWPDEPGPS